MQEAEPQSTLAEAPKTTTEAVTAGQTLRFPGDVHYSTDDVVAATSRYQELYDQIRVVTFAQPKMRPVKFSFLTKMRDDKPAPPETNEFGEIAP